MTAPTLNESRQAWSSPPVDGIGYLASAGLLALPDEAFLHLIREAERERYGGWRNHQGNWRRLLGPSADDEGLTVLDYGCGIGLEALQWARARNDVTVADIVPENIDVACRTLHLHGYGYSGINSSDVTMTGARFDVVLCNGVLHHIPDPAWTMRTFHRVLQPGGQVRLMVYSDEAWRIATGTEPPDTVVGHPLHDRYWRTWDSVGGYADWYNRDRLEQRFGDLFTIRECGYLTERREYLGAILVKR